MADKKKGPCWKGYEMVGKKKKGGKKHKKKGGKRY